MPFSILHISDLHRTPRARISNVELLSALLRDRDSYTKEVTPIRAPDAIVVSGDVVQGVSLDVPHGHAELARQYAEAEDFLGRLADAFLDGDRSRVVIVPGNHDIDWQVAFKAMTLVSGDDTPPDLIGALQSPSSPYRWSWKRRELYRIVDADLYASRLDAYRKFFGSFYKGVELLRIDAASDANIFELWDGRLALAAFNSCHGNDCFAFHGHIPASIISQTDLDLRSLGPFALVGAVWHHNIEGPPYRTDYMDIELVRAMVGRGFRLGFFGHQHRAQVLPQTMRLAAPETMVLLGAGALCAGGSELPDGAHRQYSILELNDDLCSGRVHVREVADADLFAPAALHALARRSHSDVSWERPTNAVGQSVDPTQMFLHAVIEAAEKLLKTGAPDRALDRLWGHRANLDGYGRQVLLESAERAGAWRHLAELVEAPRSMAELVIGVTALEQQGEVAGARAFLDANAAPMGLPETQRKEIDGRLSAIERLRKK